MIYFSKINKIMAITSLILCILSIYIILKYNFNLGLEFTGGIEIEIVSENKIEIIEIENKLNFLGNLKIKFYGSKKSMQIIIKNIEKTDNLEKMIRDNLPSNIKILKIDYIGSEINKETVKNSINSIILSIISMFTYLSFRFQITMALSSIITLIHDILLILGMISFLNIELNLIVLSSIFTVFGYSVNDKIIIFDRIRENLKINPNKSLKDIIDLSINKTLSRTIMTSLTTLCVTIILVLFAEKSLFWFSIILSIGIIIGTYSSIYVATTPLLIFNKYKKK